MNSKQWLAYYEANKEKRPKPKWNLPSPLDPAGIRVLAESLSHFQLGETGDGSFLLAGAREQVPDDVAYHEALKLFVAEEVEHARLLECLVLRFGGRTIQRHWTHSLFRLVRRALGFKFEIQLFLIAEIVGTAYYRLLRSRTRDCVLDQACALILADEKRHIEFHADWLGDFHARLLPLESAAWRGQFQILFALATRVAWFDHRKGLAAAGSTRGEFLLEARRECIRFLCSLAQNAEQRVKKFAPVPVAS